MFPAHSLMAVLLTTSLFAPRPLIEQVQQTPILIFAALEMCLAIAYFSLWCAARDYTIFRSMAIFFALIALDQSWQYFGGDSWPLRTVAVAMLVQIAAEAMRIPNRLLKWSVWPVSLFALIAGWIPSMAGVRDWPVILSQISLAVLIVQGLRIGTGRDRIIATAFSAHFLLRMTLSATFRRLTGVGNGIRVGGWEWSLTAMSLTTMGGVTLAVFVRDLIQDRREKLRMAAELAASRAVQQVLIPAEIPAIRGFRIQSEYKPFGEVGGDFFQILPQSEGGVLVIVGDVSGKGMPAAMMVSLLVGAFHSLAETTRSVGEILEGLNRRVLGRSNGGFTTCILVRAAIDGTITIANAGHLAPYVDGAELQIENGLPLGLGAEAVYPESTFELTPETQLTLLTDGVVEARAGTGELFGFERTAAISGKPADAIVRTAQDFGQNDDITVVTLTRLPGGDLAGEVVSV